MAKVLVQLGRIGDILNVLPIAYEQFIQGNRLTILTAKEFSTVLDGVNYVDRLIYNGRYEDLNTAVSYMTATGHRPLITQVYGNGVQYMRKTESYMRDSYHRLGLDHRYEQLSLLFDRRNAEREAALIAQVDWSKPVVFVNFGGHSCPFSRGPALLEHLRHSLPGFNVVDLGPIKATRFYDLLGLLDKASALVTIDTATLHLAKASAVPVVALVGADPWVRSTRSANHLLHRTYLEVDPDEVVEAIQRTSRRASKLVHVWSDFNMAPSERERQLRAATSWEREYKLAPWVPCPVTPDKLKRDAQKELGDLRPAPFVKDFLEIGMRETKRDSDIVVLTNSDVGFTPGTSEMLNRLVSAKGSAYAYRFDHSPEDVKAGEISYLKCVSGAWCGGVDLVAFTRKWLKMHFASLPDMVLGRTKWDTVYRDIVKRTGGGEAYGSIYHEGHASFWIQEPKTAGNLHNINLAADYDSKHDTTRPWRDEWK
jgi:hypothetical protein